MAVELDSVRIRDRPPVTARASSIPRRPTPSTKPSTPHGNAPFAILSGGLACELALFFIAPSPDFRYSHWLVITTIIGATVVFVSRWRGEPFDVRPSPGTRDRIRRYLRGSRVEVGDATR